MSATMTISLRVPPEVRDQLERAAAEGRTTMSAVAVSAIRAYLDGGVVAADGPLVEVIAGLYADVGGQCVPAEREMALALARTAQAGGTAGVAAVKELRALVAVLGIEDDDLGDLSVPEWGESHA